MTKEGGCEWYQSNHYDFAYNRWCFLDRLKGPKLVLTCVKKALGDLYAPFRHLIELTVGVPLRARGGKGLYKQKLLKCKTLIAVSAIWAQLPRRQMAYGYMGFSAMCHLGSIFLVAWAPSKQTPHFLRHKTLKPVFADFHREISPLRVPKNYRRLYGKS